jgi:hypothetical protein
MVPTLILKGRICGRSCQGFSVVGSFYSNKYRTRKVRASRLTSTVWEFSDFISEQGLMVSRWREVLSHDLTIKTPLLYRGLIDF